MAIKKIETRIQNKIDFLANWENTDLELLPGEIAFVKVIDQEANITDENQTEPDTGESTQTYSILLKVGEADENGNPKAFKDLLWLSAPASDVYDWAKQPEKPSYTFEEVGADEAGTANNEIRIHNVDTLAHSDIRDLVANLDSKFKDYYTSSDINGQLAKKADLVNGKVAQGQLPNNVINPINISAFANDAEYQTAGQVAAALASFYAKTDTYSKDEINNKLKSYYTSNEVNGELVKKADLVSGKVPTSQLPDSIVNYQQTQANWNQTDSTKVDFIKNKPTDVSAFANDVKYQTEGQVATTLENYFPKSETYSRAQANTKFSEKADLVEGKVPQEQLPDCVQADWEQSNIYDPAYIKNKPFYIQEKGFNLAWEGNKAGLAFYDAVWLNPSMFYYKVAEDVPTADFIYTNKWRVIMSNNNHMTDQFYVEGGEGYCYLVGQTFFTSPVVIHAYGTTTIPWENRTIDLPALGVYFGQAAFDSSMRVSELIQDDLVATLDDKYLSENIARTSEIKDYIQEEDRNTYYDAYNDAVDYVSDNYIPTSFISTSYKANNTYSYTNLAGTAASATEHKGSIKLGDILIQWGRLNAVAVSPKGLHKFPIKLLKAYSTTAYTISLSNWAAEYLMDISYYNKSESGFEIHCDSYYSGNSKGYLDWMTIGKA